MRGLKFIILGAAVLAGVGAVALVQNELQRARDAAGQFQAEPAEVEKTRILVATKDMNRGHPLKPEDLEWREWPLELVTESYINEASRPEAVEQAGNFLVKSAIVAGEPVTEAKLIKINHPGVMSAMVRKGMRAVAIQVSLETGVGGFILPGDFVDVILTRDEDIERRRADGTFREETILITNTLLRTVRVMAIDTIFQTEDEATTATKRTATLEVTPEMAELLALAEKAGRVTLALRSLTELVNDEGEVVEDPQPSMVFDVATFAGGSLPGQAHTGDYAARAPQAAEFTPAPIAGGDVLIVRGGVKRTTLID
ncbi:MAG: Flp pilus assembly protein CpaB [Pseudomonadota bacterium]